MSQPKINESIFLDLLEKHGPIRTAEISGVNLRNVYRRRTRLEAKLKRAIKVPRSLNALRQHIYEHPHRCELKIKTGVVLIGSDSHYWPGPASTAHRAFVHFCKELQPEIVIKNGDVMDGSKISRHPPIGWEKRPDVIDEIEVARVRLGEIQAVVKPNTKLAWPLGNHDSRYETRLATVAPEYARIHGVHLQDHFPAWTPCWSAWINDDVVVKHRFKSGIHAPHNNTLWAGKTILTGHLHSLKIMPISDYSGTRWGVDCGTLADPYGPQFVDYTEDNPKNWRSGFIVLTFHKGKLLWPEIVHVLDQTHVNFRGKVIKV